MAARYQNRRELSISGRDRPAPRSKRAAAGRERDSIDPSRAQRCLLRAHGLKDGSNCNRSDPRGATAIGFDLPPANRL